LRSPLFWREESRSDADGSAQRFGNLRWEVMAAMMNGWIALFVIGGLITYEAIDRFSHPRVI